MSDQPRHLALIMDGNGRWAQARGKNRFFGHKKGAEVAQNIVEHCIRNTNIKYLTLYAFSTENWARPREEINFLFHILNVHLEKKSQILIDNNVVLKTIGDLTPLPHSLKQRIKKMKLATQSNTGLVLTLGLNYGGRQEVIEATNRFIQENPGKPISEDLMSFYLKTDELPHPDFIIRTSGEMRLSNFMVWQAAYTELYFTDTLWPDFKFQELQKALNHFAQRQRRFGSVTIEDLKNSKESEESKNSKDSKSFEDSRDSKNFKESKNSENSKSFEDSGDSKILKSPKILKIQRKIREIQRVLKSPKILKIQRILKIREIQRVLKIREKRVLKIREIQRVLKSPILKIQRVLKIREIQK